MEEIFREVAREIKSLHNGALAFIENGNYDEAERLFQSSAGICNLLGYREGLALSFFSMANLEILRNEYMKSLNYGKLSLQYFGKEEDKEKALSFLRSLSMALVKKGMELESMGIFSEALEFYEMAVPFLDEKRKSMVFKEIRLLKEVSGNESESYCRESLESE